MRLEIRLSGSGGQGLLLAGLILAEAAGKFEGLECIQLQSYGPEARGGASKSDVIISDAKILNPKPGKLDVMLALSQEAVDRYSHKLKKNGLMIMDRTLACPPGIDGITIPLIETAHKVTGIVLTANMVGLGALCRLARGVSRESMIKAIESRVPKGTSQVNIQAFEAGYQLAPPRLRKPVMPEIEERIVLTNGGGKNIKR